MEKGRRLVSTIVALTVLLMAPVALYAGAGKTHDMTAEVVSIDTKTKMITLKDDKGENHTAPLLENALAQAANFKAGDKVLVSCKDNEKGEHLGVASIKAAVAPAPKG